MTKNQQTAQQELRNLLPDKRIKALDYETNLFAFIIYNLINRSEANWFFLHFYKLNWNPYCRHVGKKWLKMDTKYEQKLRNKIFPDLKDVLELDFTLDEHPIPFNYENGYGEVIDDYPGAEYDPIPSRIAMQIPTDNAAFMENYDEYIENYKQNKLTGRYLFDFEFQEARINRYIETLKKYTNGTYSLTYDKIKSFSEENEVALLEYLQYQSIMGKISITDIKYEKNTFVLGNLNKIKIYFKYINKEIKRFEKIDSINFEFDNYEQLKNVIINGEILKLPAGKLKVLRDILKTKDPDDIGSNSLSSQVSKINSAFKEFQKQHGIFDTKHLINPKNDEGIYTINDDFCSLIKGI